MRDTVKNERGNISIFVLGLLVILAVMFVLVLNLSNVLVAKEQANSAAQQASLAATAELYDKMYEVIEEYESEVIGLVDSYPENIEEKVDKEVERLSSGEMSGYTLNEIQTEAFDRVLAEELSKGLGDDLLREKIEEELEFNWSISIRQTARNAILANGGSLEEAELTLFEDGRIMVSASRDIEITDSNGWLSGVEENIARTSAGPEMLFVKELKDWEERTYSLN